MADATLLNALKGETNGRTFDMLVLWFSAVPGELQNVQAGLTFAKQIPPSGGDAEYNPATRLILIKPELLGPGSPSNAAYLSTVLEHEFLHDNLRASSLVLEEALDGRRR